ncbi:TIGR00269 family protein [Candidatus Woesearchaeota archaeon]|nr:TIGR00269 family protein [Candidatus Woesearchaeota archaeon]
MSYWSYPETLPLTVSPVSEPSLESEQPEEYNSHVCLQRQDIQESHSIDPAAFEQRVQATIDQYKLFSKGDKVLVACSGGKDSTVLLHVLWKLGYTLEAITVDAAIGCYTKENLKNLKEVCARIQVPLHIIEFRKEFGKSLCYIQSVLKERGYNYKSCHTCGVLRRYLLNRESKKIKPRVLATGHNMDDEAQAVLMNFFRGSLTMLARTGPKSGFSTASLTSQAPNSRFIPRVKPLYFIPEQDIIAYSKHYQFPVYYGECPCSSDAYRREMKSLFLSLPGAGLDKEQVKKNIVDSFLTIKSTLVSQLTPAGHVNECPICGEPSAKDICNACALLAKIQPQETVQEQKTSPYKSLHSDTLIPLSISLPVIPVVSGIVSEMGDSDL